jgi:cytochrome c-type biogenesis protein CcmH
MTLFWVLAAALIAMALWFVVTPLLGVRHPESLSGRELNLAVVRDKVAELEADKARGVLSEENFSTARQELEHELLRDATESPGTGAPASARLSRRTAMAAIVALPAAAVGLYLVFGGGHDVFQPRRVAQADSGPMEVAAAQLPHPQGQSAMSIEDATRKLAERLQREPDDADGWLLLARSYEYLGRDPEARAAAARAAALGKSSEAVPAPAPAASVSDRMARADPAGEMAAVAAIVGPHPGVGESSEAAAAAAADPSISQLEQRLAMQPEDVEGWTMLGRSYQALKRYTDASAAYERAVKLRPADASLLADYADALAAANGYWLPGAPMQWVDKALSIDPNHPKALWLAATAGGQQGDHAGALALWTRLQQVLPADSADTAAVAANIEETRAALGGGALTDRKPQSVEPNETPSAAAAIALRGRVTIDPRLAGAVGADDTVYIYARAAQGPRMPLAVMRKRGKDLPMEFVLDDSMAVTPSLRLSDYPELVVGARVSKSGDAIAQPGDLEGVSTVVKPADGLPVAIVIDKTRS